MPSVEFAAEALADLRSIVSFTIERWGPSQARTYVTGLRTLCAEIAAMPKIGKEADWLLPGLRVLPYRSHVIYYRASPRGITVVAIVHKRQDPVRRLRPGSASSE